jgi:hypothetical protein
MVREGLIVSFPRKRESRLVPAQAGNYTKNWIPVFTGMTEKR